MTWNLWWRFGDWRQRRKAILSVLDRERPDILGLQEVWADDRENLAGWLAGELGMHWVFGAPSDQQRWRDRVDDQTVSFGVAALSRWPLRGDKVCDLPQDPSRPVLGVTVEAPHANVPLVVTHLSVQGGTARRLAQLEFVAQTVAGLEDTGHPVIVVGDFNAEPDSDEVRRFAGAKTVPFVQGQVFFDAWRWAGPADPGFTWDRANPNVGEWIEPSSRIDYIYVQAKASSMGRILSARLAGDGPEGEIWPSDHAGVISELSDG